MSPLSSLHIDILIQLRLAGKYGAPLSKLLTELRTGGYRGLAQPTLENGLRDLADRNFAAFVDGSLTQSWRITALGISTLQEDGL